MQRFRNFYIPRAPSNVIDGEPTERQIDPVVKLIYGKLFGLAGSNETEILATPGGALYTANANGNGLITPANPLNIKLGTASAQTQTQLAGDNQIIIAAAGAGVRNILLACTVSCYGTGTAPTAAAPLLGTIKDGATNVQTIVISAFVAQQPVFNAGDVGIAGTVNTQMVIDIPTAGANNSTTINIIYTTG